MVWHNAFGEEDGTVAFCGDQFPRAIEAFALSQRPAGEDGLTAVDRPALPGALHALRHQRPARRLDRAQAGRQVLRTPPLIVHACEVAPEVLRVQLERLAAALSAVMVGHVRITLPAPSSALSNDWRYSSKLAWAFRDASPWTSPKARRRCLAAS
jgi:hypothetical protein